LRFVLAEGGVSKTGFASFLHKLPEKPQKSRTFTISNTYYPEIYDDLVKERPEKLVCSGSQTMRCDSWPDSVAGCLSRDFPCTLHSSSPACCKSYNNVIVFQFQQYSGRFSSPCRENERKKPGLCAKNRFLLYSFRTPRALLFIRQTGFSAMPHIIPASRASGCVRFFTGAM